MKNLKSKISSFYKKAVTRNEISGNRQFVDWMNKYSVVLQFILACVLCFVIEWVSRHSFGAAYAFMMDKTKVFLYNALIVFATFLVVYLFKRRMQIRITLSAIWLFLGVINGCVLAARVTPFNFADIKLVGDLFAMKSNYFSTTQAIIAIVAVILFVTVDVFLFVKGPSYQGRVHRLVASLAVGSCFVWLPMVTKAAVNTNIITDYFENIALGYEDYGFVYGFSTSVVDRGMSKPETYSEEVITALNQETDAKVQTEDDSKDPNVICVLLESFIDPYEVNYLEFSEDPVPTFHQYENQFTSGYLQVPVVGAGTANTEFEMLTGMSMRYFGTGEYPYKTILKSSDCESVASDLASVGYDTHVVHNNTAKFYSRNNAFSQMGFDSFTSKEFMNIQEYTPLGTWPTDNILVSEVEKAMDVTDSSDFVYTITVQGHGAYPTEKVIENPEVVVSGAADEESNNEWEYYVNEIHEVDKFIADLTAMLEERGEDTVVVFFGDHLPSMNLTEADMKTGSIFETKYITWNNFGMEKKDADVTSYQLMSKILNDVGIHEGTMLKYHQANSVVNNDDVTYQAGLENLQYDLLYGERYTYNGEDKYPASDLEMGVVDVVIDSYEIKTAEEVEELEVARALAEEENSEVLMEDAGIDEASIEEPVEDEDATVSEDSVSEDSAKKKYVARLYITGENFTPWSKVYVNGDKLATQFIDDKTLSIKISALDLLNDGTDSLVVNQVGSSTVLRSSNEVKLDLADDLAELEQHEELVKQQEELAKQQEELLKEQEETEE